MTNPANHTENREKFFARLEPVLAPSELMKVEIAYALSKHAHRAQMRKELDGEGSPIRYFEHLRRVALVCIDDLEITDPEMVITCLMHDSIEDTRDINPGMLEHLFGAEVSKMVKLLTKEPKEGYYERLMKYGNWKVWTVKGCDRYDNIRSLKDTPVEFQRKQLAETRKVIYPMLNQLCDVHNTLASRTLRKLIHEAVESFQTN